MWKNERFLWEKGAGDTRCGIFLKNIETLWRKRFSEKIWLTQRRKIVYNDIRYSSGVPLRPF